MIVDTASIITNIRTLTSTASLYALDVLIASMRGCAMSQAASTGSQRMSNEEYIELIKKHPEEVIKEAARQRLINFARYMRRDFVAMPFHKVYYEVLDLFAHGLIRKLIIQQPPQHGKALPVDTPVLTTDGWKMHGELQVGDYVFGEDGKPKKVLNNFGTYKWHTQEVVFADSTVMVAAHEHMWKIYTSDSSEPIIVETRQLTELLPRKPYIRRVNGSKMYIKCVLEYYERNVNCIQVEGGMYLAGRRLVPTHNSEGSSRMLPSFMLGLNPDAKLCIGSYSTTIARDFNRDVQRIIDTKEYAELFPNSFLNSSNMVTVSSNYLRNSEVIEMVGHRGGLRVVGRGGSLTSKTVDVSILDDVYKDYAEGNSPVIRESAWKWYTTVVRTRLHNDSQELIVFTRWHEDDLIGRIEKSGEQIIEAKTWQDLVNVPKGAWLRINFEAIKESEPTELDPRPKGSALWDSRHSLEKLLAQRALDPVQFNCLFQGNPSSVEGRLYQTFKTYIEKADWGEYVRTGAYVDVADEGSDYLAAVSYDIYKSENTVWNEQKRKFEPILYALVTDIEFTDESTDVTTITVPNLINRNGVQKAWIESNNGGAQFEKVVRKKIKALTVPFYQSGNKESRVITASAVVNSQIIFPFGWEKRYPTVHEHLTSFLRNFSANAHDDIEDCLTGIAEKELVDGNCLPYGHGSRGIKVH